MVFIAVDDTILLQQIANGDREAFQAFYERYAGKALGYVRMLCRERELAEDLTQEAFLAVWRRAGSYSAARGEPAAWLYTILRNKLVDQWRRRSPAATVEEEQLAVLSSEGTGPGREVALSLRQALTDLKPEQRQALELAYFGGLTYEETAARLQLPLGTLKSRIRTGLALLRQTLDSAPMGPPSA